MITWIKGRFCIADVEPGDLPLSLIYLFIFYYFLSSLVGGGLVEVVGEVIGRVRGGVLGVDILC